MKTALLILGLMALPALVGYYFKSKSSPYSGRQPPAKTLNYQPVVSAPR